VFVSLVADVRKSVAGVSACVAGVNFFLLLGVLIFDNVLFLNGRVESSTYFVFFGSNFMSLS
jgi:hypothetical protein